MHGTRNTALHNLISLTGWSNPQSARAVNSIGTEMGLKLTYDASTVCHWLTGTVPRKASQPAILEALARKLDQPVTRAMAGLGLDKDTPDTDPDTVARIIELGSADLDPSRRTVLGAIGLYSVALTVPGWPDVIGRAQRARQLGTRIGQNEVNTVIAMSERLSDLDDEFGGHHARPLAAAFLINTVARYLDCEATDKTRSAMLSAAADLTYLTAWMAMDENKHGLAQQYYLESLRLAGAAGDHLTYCVALRGMSVQAVGLGHGQKSLQYADAAAAAAPAAGPRMLAFLTGQQAHASAAVHDRRTAFRQLKEAEIALDKATSGSAHVGGYHPAALNYHTSHILYELGDITGSITAMQESNRHRPPTERGARARSTALLAERQFEARHLEAACSTWNTFLDDYQHLSSARCDDHFRTMLRAVRQHPTNSTARTLAERARTLSPAST